jgi:uncharacterized membrane protein YraQ (UPF0718 family)
VARVIAKSEWRVFLLIVGVFCFLFWMPIGSERFQSATMEALHLARWYAREHVLLCLVPAFFIAGAIAVFVSQGGVMRYLGPRANKLLAYAVASISGTILAVCSCTVLPLFAGIYRMGAGIGPATAFLYSGPAINVLAIILTARVLGIELGIARAVGAIVFSVVIGGLMHIIYRKEELRRAEAAAHEPEPEDGRPLWQTTLVFGAMVGVLVFANWGEPRTESGLWAAVHSARWPIAGLLATGLGISLVIWIKFGWWKIASSGLCVVALAVLFPERPVIAFASGAALLSLAAGSTPGEGQEWLGSTWAFAKQILPLLLAGVLIAGALLGRPGHEGLIPSEWVSGLVGGNSLKANFFASVVGAFMYFATLTEVPILEGLIGNGMGKGPALALLLSGPALSLPNMLVIRSVLGTQKTIVFVALVVTMATMSGLIYGAVFA